MVKPLGFDNKRGSSRRDPRSRVEGGDIFERRALKQAITAVEKGTSIGELNSRRLGATTPEGVASLRENLADRLARSGRSVGGPFNRTTLNERRTGVTTDRFGNSLQTLGRDVRDRDRISNQTLFAARRSISRFQNNPLLKSRIGTRRSPFREDED